MIQQISKGLIPVLLISVFPLLSDCEGYDPLPYRDPDETIEMRVKDLLGRMTLEEKIAQLQCFVDQGKATDWIAESAIGNVGTILRSFPPRKAAEEMNRIQKIAMEETRLGIPLLMHDEALHGLLGKGATSFPQAIALAATWNTDLMERVATAIARETRSRGIRQVLSPVVNIARDVRWGRIEETYGEDPFLTSRMGVAFCKSFEDLGVIATPKHFIANFGDGGRDSDPVHFSERLLREIYFPGFKACIQEGKAQSIMAAYNAYDGVPCNTNHWLLTDVLRTEWGFNGFVVSDYFSVVGILQDHHTASTKKEASKQALEAGLDIELPYINVYGQPLLEAVREGLVSLSMIDQSVRRILEAKFRLGLFDDPYVDPAVAEEVNDNREHRNLALQAAREAIVLLKNERSVLPLNKRIGSIAVIGPLANVAKLGGYSGYGMKTVSILEGVGNRLSSDTDIIFELGCDAGSPIFPHIQSRHLIPIGRQSGEHGLRGEYFNNRNLTGPPDLIRIDEQVQFEWRGQSPGNVINPELFSARWTGKLVPPETREYEISVTTDDGVRLYIDDRLVIDDWENRAKASKTVKIQLEANREYDIRMEYFQYYFGAFASLGWDYKGDADEPIRRALDAARKADAVILCVGILEGEAMDRDDLDLPREQEELIQAVSAIRNPTIVVLIGGSAITMRNWIDDVEAIVNAWYPGEEGGNAIADILFGNYNPAGRLPLTFPNSVVQVPLYYNSKPTGRNRDPVDLIGKPLFPFGYGLSYTEYEYGNLKISKPYIKQDDTLVLSFDVRNTGARKGDEVVQLYLHDVVGSVSRPHKELKGFKRISLKPNEMKTVQFMLKPDDLAMLDSNLEPVVEPGQFEVMIGSCSEDIRLRGLFEVVR